MGTLYQNQLQDKEALRLFDNMFNYDGDEEDENENENSQKE